MSEIWRRIEGVENSLYLISSLGRVRHEYHDPKKLRVNRFGYAVVGLHLSRVNGTRRKKNFLVHRIMFRAFGDLIPGNGENIDHINGDKLDNRIENLRMVSVGENNRAFQKARGGSSIYRGVCLEKSSGRWRVKIHDKGIRRTVGRYETELEAAIAWNDACDKYGYLPEAKNIIKKGINL